MRKRWVRLIRGVQLSPIGRTTSIVKTGPNPYGLSVSSELFTAKSAVRPGCSGSDAAIRNTLPGPFEIPKDASPVSKCCVVIVVPPWRFPASVGPAVVRQLRVDRLCRLRQGLVKNVADFLQRPPTARRLNVSSCKTRVKREVDDVLILPALVEQLLFRFVSLDSTEAVGELNTRV